MPDRSRLDEVLSRCAAGLLPVRVAAMHLMMETDSPESAQAAVVRALETSAMPAAGRLQDLERIVTEHPQAWTTVHAILATVEHRAAAGDPVARWAGLFDAAVRISPEGSVALYSLGSAELLAAATLEVVSLLSRWDLLGLDRTVLDVGCGIGRLEAALAPLSAAVIGIDISPGMIAEARTRCAGLLNVRLFLGNGHDFTGIADGSADLAVLVDTFPYLLLSEGGVAADYLAEISRVLPAGGDLVILNYSYRGDVGADRADLERLAGPLDLRLARVAERAFPSWDAPAFHLVKSAASAHVRQ
ncbi:MAG TPA: class I SAM-dependent methyltransferase [Steroidobacteraceae bacterium]|nr:class I SAM-dependent methyltransferase [Steroidobacteraceae bacterium]